LYTAGCAFDHPFDEHPDQNTFGSPSSEGGYLVCCGWIMAFTG